MSRTATAPRIDHIAEAAAVVAARRDILLDRIAEHLRQAQEQVDQLTGEGFVVAIAISPFQTPRFTRVAPRITDLRIKATFPLPLD